MASVSNTPLAPGQVVGGKYRVERVLGEGGMGIVVAAKHLKLDQRVAIKVLIPDAKKNAQAVERFSREATVAAKITSEHVVRVYDVGTLDGGEPYMVMEYLEGCDLKELVDEGPLSVADACEFILQSCEALAELHKAGIIHRDLKPANIYLTKRADGSPVIKLLDFGISKFTVHPDDPKLDPSMTATSAVMGSPGYMSPEQLKSTRDVDERADIWSLGTILYELLTGTPAFFGESMPQLCAMIVSEYPPLPSALRDDLPIDLERAILRCLEKRAERRFADVGELAQVLAVYAPERAKVSIDRIEAIIGSQGRRRPLSSRPPRPEVSAPPSRAIPPSARVPRSDSSAALAALAQTQAAQTSDVVSGSPPIVRSTSTGSSRPERRSGGLVASLLLLAAGGLGFAVYAGKLDVRGLLGQPQPTTQIAPSASAAAVNVDPPDPPAAIPEVSPEASAAIATSDAAAAPDAVAAVDAATDANGDADDSDDDDDTTDAAAPVASAAPRPAPRYYKPSPKGHPRTGHPRQWKRK